MNDLITEVDFINKLRGSLMCFVYLIDMSSNGICTTRHWQTSGRLVQELKACTVMLLLLATPFTGELDSELDRWAMGPTPTARALLIHVVHVLLLLLATSIYE